MTHSRSAFSLFGTLVATLLLSAHSFAQDGNSSDVKRGEYLARAGDCEFCHTESDGASFAGGRGIPTPFGMIYSVNITPDKNTGIGQWSEQDFYNAMHSGVSSDGTHLYPAFPYPWFTKLARSDVDAIWAYLKTLTPVNQGDKKDQLPWILKWRGEMVGWNTLYFDKGEFKNVPSRSAQWNRGAYLVEGLAHCGACHTPDNFAGGTKHGDAFQGGSAGTHWYAPGLGDNLRDGVGDWTEAEIAEYLKTGANLKSASAGPMTDVVMNSTQYLSDADLEAIATYLKNRQDAPKKSPSKTAALSADALARGQALYFDNCTACHMEDGRGIPNVFPPLTGSAAIQADEPGTVIHVVLAGARMAAPALKPTALAMPGFGWKLSDREIADVVNYSRHAWGNLAPSVDADIVAKVRKDIEPEDRPSRDATTAHSDAPARKVDNAAGKAPR